MNYSVISTTVCCAMLSACMTATVPATPSSSAIVLTNADGMRSITVHVEVARDEASREKGLMNRDHLNPDAGMLFAFDAPQILSFWMKNTLIPLDVLFFDHDGNFVSASTMEPCKNDPCPSYRSSGPATSALEVNEGFTKEHGIGRGWTLATNVQ